MNYREGTKQKCKGHEKHSYVQGRSNVIQLGSTRYDIQGPENKDIKMVGAYF